MKKKERSTPVTQNPSMDWDPEAILRGLAANDNLEGLGYEVEATPANDNEAQFDCRAIGIEMPVDCQVEEEIGASDIQYSDDGPVRELDFTDTRAGMRGFLAED